MIISGVSSSSTCGARELSIDWLVLSIGWAADALVTHRASGSSRIRRSAPPMGPSPMPCRARSGAWPPCGRPRHRPSLRYDLLVPATAALVPRLSDACLKEGIGLSQVSCL
jgi:hypothetical protein